MISIRCSSFLGHQCGNMFSKMFTLLRMRWRFLFFCTMYLTAPLTSLIMEDSGKHIARYKWFPKLAPVRRFVGRMMAYANFVLWCVVVWSVLLLDRLWFCYPCRGVCVGAVLLCPWDFGIFLAVVLWLSNGMFKGRAVVWPLRLNIVSFSYDSLGSMKKNQKVEVKATDH